jgi:hypothetical protein
MSDAIPRLDTTRDTQQAQLEPPSMAALPLLTLEPRPMEARELFAPIRRADAPDPPIRTLVCVWRI